MDAHRHLRPGTCAGCNPWTAAREFALLHGGQELVSEPLDRNRKHIANPTLGLDDLGCAGIALKLAAQTQNLHVDAAIEHIFMDARRLQQVLAAERPLRCFKEGHEKRVFPFRQSHRRTAGVAQSPRFRIELPSRKAVAPAAGTMRRRGLACRKPPHNCTDPRKQLAQMKWLRQIVIGPQLKANDAIDLVTPVTCYYDNGQFRIRPDFPQQIEAVLLTEPQIEDNEIGPATFELAGHVLAAGRHQCADVIFCEIV
jgi:hypothetical protein